MQGRIEYLTDDGLQVYEFVALTPETIDKIFEEAKEQADYLFGLYRVIYPNWDELEKVHGWPTITKPTWSYICEKAIAFDKEVHPNVIAGGLWMNNGFRSNWEGAELEDWFVIPARVTLA